MSSIDDHTHISEQLRAYVEGSLPPERAAEIRAHVSNCEECAAELMAVESLMELPDESPSELEAQRLHHGVFEALRSATPEAAPVQPVTAAPFRYRLAQALGAAALLAVIGGMAYVTLFRSEGEQFAGEGAGSVAEVGEQMADIGSELKFRQPQPSPELGGARTFEEGSLDTSTQNEKVGVTSGEGAGGGDERAPLADAVSATPRPLYVRGAGIINDRTLTLVGRFGLPLVLFPEAYTPEQAMDLQTSFLQQLANAAETDARSEQVLRCGSSVLARPHPVLPALATFGRLDNETTLVMAFAWSDSPGGRLDRFMVWTWRSGDCEAFPSYRSGYINR